MRRKDRIRVEQYLKKIQLAKSSAVVDPYETKEQQQKRIERCKKDIRYMIEYYFPHYATSKSADFQIQFAKMVKKDPTFKGFCEWGRGLAKSVYNNIFIPYWLWLNGQSVYLVIIGTSSDKAEQLLDDLKVEFESNPRIINDFGTQIKHGSWEGKKWTTKGGFTAQALGMGQNVRGLRVGSERPNHLVIDDAEDKDTVKNPKRQNAIASWIEKDLMPTMDGDIRRWVMSNNRSHPRMIQTVLQDKHPNWKVHHVKAYDAVTYEPAWKEKYDDEYYKDLEDEIGVIAAQSEYNGEPHVEGSIFTDDQQQWCKLPRLNHMIAICGHWDIAYAGTPTADYNAVRVWGLKDKQFFYINSFVKQSKMRAAVDFMLDYQSIMPDSVLIMWRFESQFWNDEVERTIREAEEAFGMELNLVKVDTPKGNKYSRILRLQSYYQNGRIWYNEKMKSHNDTQVGWNQQKGIEPGYSTHDDAPDADQQAIEYLSKYIFSGRTSKPMTGKRVSKNRW